MRCADARRVNRQLARKVPPLSQADGGYRVMLAPRTVKAGSNLGRLCCIVKLL